MEVPLHSIFPKNLVCHHAWKEEALLLFCFMIDVPEWCFWTALAVENHSDVLGYTSGDGIEKYWWLRHHRHESANSTYSAIADIFSMRVTYSTACSAASSTVFYAWWAVVCRWPAPCICIMQTERCQNSCTPTVAQCILFVCPGLTAQ